MIEITNDGPSIVSTNYFDTEHAEKGFFYLTWNAGVGRILVPDVQLSALNEMETADFVIVSRGSWADQNDREALELLWEDSSKSPYVITLVTEQCDRLLPDTDQGGGFKIAAWTRSGIANEWPGKYREVENLPFLKSWKEH